VTESFFRRATARGFLAFLLSICLAAVALPARAQDPAPSPARASATEKLVPVEQTEARAVPADTLDEKLLGLPVLRVEVVLEGKRWAKPAKVTGVRPGEPLSPDLARRAMRELDDGGTYAGLAAEAVPSENGVVLRLFAVPSRTIASVQIDGGVLDRNETLKSSRLDVGSEITEADVDDLGRRLSAVYDTHGFPKAHIAVNVVDLDEPGDVLVSIQVEPGEPRLVSQRIFVIEPAWDKHVGDLKSEYEVEAGDRLDQKACDEADRKLAEILRQTGFGRARVYHKTLFRGAFSYLYVYVDSGPKLVPSFEGNTSFDADQLTRALEIEKTDATSPADLATRLKRHYVSYGFLDAEVRADERPSDDPGLTHIVFRIREEARVRVARRVLLCLAPDEDPDDVGREIDRVLEEELPSEGLFSVPSPLIVEDTTGSRGGRRAEPIDIAPAAVYTPDAYAKAMKRVRELYLGKGYLSSVIGPASVVRARCAPSSPPGECTEEPLPPMRAQCGTDDRGIPAAEPPPPAGSTCVPDSLRGVRCSPRLVLRIPVHLGPQSRIWDMTFEGNAHVSDTALAEIAALPLGEPLSLKDLEDAKSRVTEHYQDLGYAFAEVLAEVEPSPDGTRARVRFIVRERDLVIIDGIDVEGAFRTDHDLIVGRVVLQPGDQYSRRDLRLSEERIATLGPFSSVSVTLADPEVPAKRKRLLVRVTEYGSQYIEPRLGFSTGEGLRVGFEYGHRNIGGRAISLTLRLELSYLFDFMIIDSDVEKNLGPLPVSERLERRNSVRVSFPEIGLGPTFSLGVEGIDVRDNQRDFGLTREALVPSLTYRPLREVAVTLSASGELNDVQIFNADSVDDAILQNPNLERLLRFPDGTTFAVSQRLGVTWDRRDNPLSATSGTLLVGATEHVNAFPIGDQTGDDPLVSHFLKLTTRFATYFRFTDEGLSLALSISGGLNVQLQSGSKTYPDRLFYAGGFESHRAYFPDKMIPEDVADRIDAGEIKEDDVAVRGGDLIVNPRVELRIPIWEAIGIGIFLDIANLYVDPAAFDPLAWRYGAGGGLRISTPLGPLAFDGAFNLNRLAEATEKIPDRTFEDIGAIHFSVGLF
jgi:outer membrane protein assembly factor BamA